jgi:hypothetical protein
MMAQNVRRSAYPGLLTDSSCEESNEWQVHRRNTAVLFDTTAIRELPISDP